MQSKPSVGQNRRFTCGKPSARQMPLHLRSEGRIRCKRQPRRRQIFCALDRWPGGCSIMSKVAKRRPGQWVTAADVLGEEKDYCWNLKENVASTATGVRYRLMTSGASLDRLPSWIWGASQFQRLVWRRLAPTQDSMDVEARSSLHLTFPPSSVLMMSRSSLPYRHQRTVRKSCA